MCGICNDQCGSSWCDQEIRWKRLQQNKAGIIKPGCAVVSAKQKENVREILKKTAEEKGMYLSQKHSLNR